MSIVKKGLLSVGASLLLLGMAVGQNAPANNENTKSTANGGVQGSDRKFMDSAAQGGMAEVELGQLAQQNAQSQQVKDFGQRMVTDHSKANDQLKQLAAQKGVSLPTTLDSKDQATKDKLSKLQGAAFDKAYMQDMLKDHKKDIAEFQKASTSGKDPDVKNFATQTLPTLQSHMQEAQKIAPTVTGANAMSQNSSSGMSAQSK